MLLIKIMFVWQTSCINRKSFVEPCARVTKRFIIPFIATFTSSAFDTKAVAGNIVNVGKKELDN